MSHSPGSRRGLISRPPNPRQLGNISRDPAHWPLILQCEARSDDTNELGADFKRQPDNQQQYLHEALRVKHHNAASFDCVMPSAEETIPRTNKEN
jgi:hypothetical protein